MIIVSTAVKGAYLIRQDRKDDHRGFFTRLFCAKEFEEHGIEFVIAQSNMSFTQKKNTIRGMHYQVDGAEEDKLVTCMKGSILDVFIDLRRDSSTFCRHMMVELTENDNMSLLVPKGCAHGFLTLEDDSLMMYYVSNCYDAERERGVRWNDPCFGIQWPVKNPILSMKDTDYPDFKVSEEQ
jgi:dTDP-4-dehydrorhamnose 3,5-epimerase